MRCVSRLALLTAAALLVTSCASAQSSSEESETAEGLEDTDLTVVSSIDVYADLIDQIAGGSVDSQAVVSSTAVDPHSYEATPQDRLAVQNADVVVANGGGYDSFITLLASSAEKDEDVFQLIDGENTHSHDYDGNYVNEHIWYDLPLMAEFVTDFAEHLAELAPENAQAYQDNAQALAADIDDLHQRTEALDAEGHSYLATEAVSGYLLDSAGFSNRTEAEFLNAVEHGDDVSPRLYQQALDATEEIDLLSYNSQTETQQSQRIRQQAEENSVVIVEFTETIPEDTENFQTWMSENIDLIEAAIEQFDGTGQSDD